MKGVKVLPLLATVMLSGCAVSESSVVDISQHTSQNSELNFTENSPETSLSVEVTSEPIAAADLPQEQSAPETAQPAVTAESEPAPEPLYVDEYGLINEAGVVRVSQIVHENLSTICMNYPGLFDFDRDGVPEVYIVRHDGGQGLMPVEIFELAGEQIGEFEGYCRDGFCRFSYGENCVYVHNSYQHSKSISSDSIQRLTFENGVIETEYILECGGSANDRFPLLEYTYRVNGDEVTEREYFNKYSCYIFDQSNPYHEVNEVSVCAFDFGIDDYETAAFEITRIYNDYITGLNMAEILYGMKPAVYAYDDYDGDGRGEAFVQQNSDSGWFFYSNGELKEAGIPEGGLYIDYTRYGSYLLAQPFGNTATCTILGVAEGKPCALELSEYGMLIRNDPGLGFCRVDLENGIYILWDSAWDTIENAGAHTWKPYYFVIGEDFFTDSGGEGLTELVGVPVSREVFADREDVQTVFDEIETAGGTVTGAFLRGERYLNINYTLPIEGGDPGKHLGNHYKTFMIQNSVTFIDEGWGIYSASIRD